MTFEEIKECNKDFLVPTEVAPVLKVSPYSINIAAKTNPNGLGFPITFIGTRVLIPRRAFINFCEGGHPK